MQHCAATERKDQERIFYGTDGTKTIEYIDTALNIWYSFCIAYDYYSFSTMEPYAYVIHFSGILKS